MIKDHSKQTLDEAVTEVFGYEPTDEEVDSHYSKDFNDWCENYFKKEKNK